jgi:hypothetical protein
MKLFQKRIGAAAAGELRLPTGSQEELLGLGKVIPKLMFILDTTVDLWSAADSPARSRRPLSPHFNLAYSWAGDGPSLAIPVPGGFRPGGGPVTDQPVQRVLSDEVNYTAGAEYGMKPKVTLSADVIGRWIRNTARFASYPYTGTAGGGIPTAVVSTVVSGPGSATILVAVAGAKIQVGGSTSKWLVVGNVLFPLNQQGLQPGIVWTLGLDRAF